MTIPEKYTPVISHAEARIAEIERWPLDLSDHGRLSELRSLIAFCRLLNSQERLVAQALAPRLEAA